MPSRVIHGRKDQALSDLRTGCSNQSASNIEKPHAFPQSLQHLVVYSSMPVSLDYQSLIVVSHPNNQKEWFVCQ
jgi:hypothetical protein